ncbi:MAG: sugar ABC transporter substrate-binding protein [Clostridiales bacterium]|nr:sugar ABC transporter substrate-binding protein [Clostridiales bacterium]
MKKLIALLLALIMVFALVACASSETKTEEPAKAEEPAKTEEPAAEEPAAETPAADGEIKVAFITQSLSNASQAYAWTQFQKYASDYGFTVTVFDEDYDAQNGVAAIGTCIAQGYTAICINPTDPSAIIPSLMEAQEAGVIVGMYSSELPEGFTEYRDFMCGTDDVMAGEVAAQTLMEAFPDGCNVVEVGGQSGHSAQIKRHDGFVKTIEGSNINLLDSVDCEAWASEDALAITEDFIVKYGDEIDALYCHWDVGATGCIEALKNAGMNDVYVIGVDGCSVGYDQVKEGTQALCIGQSFSQMTQDAFDCITKIMNGEECPDVVWTALDIVTADTIDNFPYPEW